MSQLIREELHRRGATLRRGTQGVVELLRHRRDALETQLNQESNPVLRLTENCLTEYRAALRKAAEALTLLASDDEALEHENANARPALTFDARDGRTIHEYDNDGHCLSHGMEAGACITGDEARTR